MVQGQTNEIGREPGDEANRSISHNKSNRSDRDKGGGLTPSKNFMSPIRVKRKF